MKMKSNVNMVKGKTTSRGSSSQQAAFELKQRVVFALNKLADRDTYRIGVEDLEKTVECLTPDGVPLFLSCILDTDSEQKSAVRKECIRLMGTMATYHEDLVGPHLGKMVASIVKRLKDPDSVVRDSCIETVGVLASKLSCNRIETDGIFTMLVRPLFEALGEQNKTVQYGSALCLSRVIDSIHDPPPLVLQKMLSRTIKMLKNTHFMAKPAVVELNRSIILAGGAPTHSSLTAALTSIQEALKNNDWATRKAACTALGEIASCGVACLGSFRTSCIRSLESCRFDKVKPVRDVALQALQLWRNIPGSDTPEPSETGSSVKESCYREYGDVTSTGDSRSKNITMMKSGTEMAKKRVPLTSRIADRTYIEKSQQSGANEWQIEIAIPKNYGASVYQNDESESSSVTKSFERSNADARNVDKVGYECAEVDDKQDQSSVSNLFSESIRSKVVTNNFDSFDDASVLKSTGTSQRFAADEVCNQEQRYLAKMHDRRSLDSTVTESTSCTIHALPSQTENDMVLIKKQLLEIENKQSNLMEMLQAFTTSITDSMSMVQLKVANLELVVDKMAQELVQGGRHSDASATKLVRRSPSTASPRISICTPRSSVHSTRQPPLLPNKKTGIWEENTSAKSKSSSFGKYNSGMWTDATLKQSKSSLANFTNVYPENHRDQIRQNESAFDPVPPTKANLTNLGTKNGQWKVMKDYLSDGNLDSAYADALCSGNELLLLELLGRTGPVLESLSGKTASDLLSTLSSYLLEQRFVNSIIPWLKQLVDLSNIHGPTYLVLSAKAKRDILCAVQEAARLDVFSPAERKFCIDLGRMLRQNWGNESFRSQSIEARH